MSTPSRRSAVVAALAAALVLSVSGAARAALVLWLDGSDGATVLNTSSNPASNGEPVASWLDKAGAPQNAVAQTGNPVYATTGGPAGNPVIDFSTTPVANLVTNGPVQARTISMVHRWDTVGSGSPSYLFDLRTGVSNSYVWEGGFGPNWTVYVGDSTTSTSSIGAARNNTWQVTTFVGSSTGSDDMHIFSRYTNNEFGLGKVAEIRVYDTALSESERLAVVDELDQKWFGPPGPGPTNLALGATYSWSRVPGQPPAHYRDDFVVNGLHDVHTLGVGVFDKGDLNDGWIHTTEPSTNSPVVAQWGGMGNAPAADIVFDLGQLSLVENVILGTFVAAGANNNAPDDVSVSFSSDNVTYGPATFYDLEAVFGPLADGHHDLDLDLIGSGVADTLAQFVKLSFDGGSMAEPGGSDPDEKWMLDEVRIIGSASVVIPEPSTILVWSLLAGLAACVGRRRNR